MTDTAARPYKTGRKPQHPQGSSGRLAIPYLHEFDPEVAPGATVSFPVDVSQGKTIWKMLGNGPQDPTDPVTVPMPTGDTPDTGEGDCHWAGWGHDTMLAGADPTANKILTAYNAWSAQSQGVPAGQEQDQGTNMADAFLWALTHDENGNVVPLGEGMVSVFAPVHKDALGATMQKYQRGILLGINCTPCDQTNFPKGWTVTADCQPDQDDGHVVYLVILNADGSGVVVSWGQKVPTDVKWLGNCPTEWWIILTPADRAKMGDLAYNALVAVMATLPGVKGDTTPAAGPPPTPVVSPPSPDDADDAQAWYEAALAWFREHDAWAKDAKNWWETHVGSNKEAS